jgi:DNA-binding CsgD family transcriptional regulator
MIRLNNILHHNKQFFYVADILKLKILYTSPQVYDLLGIEREKYDLSNNFQYTHASDIGRRSRARVNVIEAGQQLFIKKSGSMLISSYFRMKHMNGVYLPYLVQCYLFYSNSPIETVYIILITTQLDKPLKIRNHGRYHWYAGPDMSFFRYPDKELLKHGSNLSERELEILSYVERGMESRDIAKMMFLSLNTINTHRRNILLKTGKQSLTEVIFDLNYIGIF